MTYVLIKSWHSVSMTFRGGAVRTRCGRGPLSVVGSLTGGLHDPGEPVRVYPTTNDLPMNERTCEVCLRLTVNDAELAG